MSPTHGKILKSRDFIRHQIGKTVGTQISDFPLPASLCAHLSFFHGANIPLTLGKQGNHYPLRAHYLIQLTSRETTFRESKCIFPFSTLKSFVEAQRGKTVRFSDIILSPPKSGHGAISRFQTATQFVFILTAVLNFREVVGDPPELLV